MARYFVKARQSPLAAKRQRERPDSRTRPDLDN